MEMGHIHFPSVSNPLAFKIRPLPARPLLRAQAPLAPQLRRRSRLRPQPGYESERHRSRGRRASRDTREARALGLQRFPPDLGAVAGPAGGAAQGSGGHE